MNEQTLLKLVQLQTEGNGFLTEEGKTVYERAVQTKLEKESSGIVHSFQYSASLERKDKARKKGIVFVGLNKGGRGK